MIHEIDPLSDLRWPEFLRGHPRASVFHTREWLQALQATYGYKPAALTTSGLGGDLFNGLVFCRVSSWVTGRRLVSVPFSDHCEPLVDNTSECRDLISGLEECAKAESYKYVELRPIAALEGLPRCCTGQDFYLHRLDLRPGAKELFHSFHRDCIQRRIGRAERSGLEITEGRDHETLGKFYGLVTQTRGRLGLPPQPLAWFRNLVKCFGESAMIRCAHKDSRPIAAMMTLEYGKSLYYKYGASEACSHKFGAMPYLFWRTIQDAISRGFEVLDMGRSECDNLGLITFKERFSAARSTLSYWRFPAGVFHPVSEGTWGRRLAKRAFSYMPNRCLIAVGTLFYRHIG